MIYETRPVTVNAVQWHKMGDHPLVIPIVCAIYEHGYLVPNQNPKPNVTSNESEYFSGCEKTCGLLRGGSPQISTIIRPGEWIVEFPDGHIHVYLEEDFHKTFREPLWRVD